MKHLLVIQTEQTPHPWESLGMDTLVGVWKAAPLDGQVDLRGTTWTQGRNKLHQVLCDTKRLWEYDYVSYCDDDLTFVEGSLDAYNEWLAKHRPAVASPTVKWWPPMLRHAKERVQGDKYYTDHVDAALVTFRPDEAAYWLPWYAGLDHISWWMSQALLCCEMKTRGQWWAVPSRIVYDNIQHRPYTLKDKDTFHNPDFLRVLEERTWPGFEIVGDEKLKHHSFRETSEDAPRSK